MADKYYNNEIKQEKVLLVGVQTPQWTDFEFENLMQEMEALVNTAGAFLDRRMMQKLPKEDGRTLLGKGKVGEIQRIIKHRNIDLVVSLNPLKPVVHRNLEEAWDCRVIDRIQLILDIFALRAKSRAGKLQVELAQYQYLLPRIIGQGLELSRLGGGIGTRGPGETKLESDRRYLRTRMRKIEKDLSAIEAHRERTRLKRQQGNEFNIGLVGYTNAGKSTILTKLTQSDTLVQDKLFATLDPLTRSFAIRGFENFTLTDTVGFIEELPTKLIHAFKSTLEEISDVDLLLHVIDAGHPARFLHEQTVLSLLKDLKMDQIPQLVVYNKIDTLNEPFQPSLFPNVQISAYWEESIELLKEEIWQTCKSIAQPYRILIPADQAQKIYEYQQNTIVESIDFDQVKQNYIVTGFKK
ncbi:GTP-binding protein HflX [Ignavigranum ruoffiae]|uniref:GTPase HflX n=1 Tax=Ignavigranum ruoffiae TaxID=89093 RepID=A0A1H9ANJ0_9LACT|nr:GTPase HflX [Ignavigranum ruoffiae]SEP78229.1 GTP-binding protein HflX [Ignavigranum ruoffiae]